MQKVIILLLICCTSLPFSSFAQFKDSLNIGIETQVGYADKSYQPFWQVSNQWGSIPNEKQYLLVGGGVHYRAGFGKYWRLNSSVQLNTELLTKQVQIAQAYASLSYNNIDLKAGRFRQRWGEVDSLLSAGSLAISHNALPVPAIELAVNKYTPIPASEGWVHFKGRWQHAWLGSDRYVKGAYLHAKNFYLLIGNQNFAFEGGLNHFVQWGGNHPQGPLPDRFQDYRIIIIGAPQKQDEKYTDAPQNIYNALGNHILITDLGLRWKLKTSLYHLYTQTPYETGRNEKIYGRDNLDALYIFGKDRLVGLRVNKLPCEVIEKVVVEYLNTSHQGGEGMFIGQFNYYNHSIYRSGWTNEGYSMGTPLLLNKAQAENYQLDQEALGAYDFISNRVQSVHVGVAGSLSDQCSYRQLFTYSRHFGNYYNGAFNHQPTQSYLQTELQYTAATSLGLKLSTTLDLGNLSNNMSFALGIQWKNTFLN
ncbi:capsule assembly Wzi family protein [Porifericola rhodea]|uniref:capsule assembly Wzi family protein n=1 Tax=Porifericola rhodea TaxID=930972 RepID=UPI0026662A36|nr:capsule assembly Wzi family protein [Porifericola rhodea]WKN32840.1 capsule assembly Wzi family protein [Porifericola rhodea]